MDDWHCDRECRFDDECRQKCNTMKLYRRLAEYEDTGLEPEYIETMKKVVADLDFAQAIRTGINLISSLLEAGNAEEDNAPLTLEELREMIGKPVWVETPGIPEYGRYAIVEGADVDEKSLFLKNDFTCRDYGKTWLAYRRKPGEKLQSGGESDAQD